MSKLQLLHGSAVQNELASDSNVEVFRYELNKFGVGALLTLGLLFLLAAFGTWLATRLVGLPWKLAFGAMILAGLTFCSMASYWINFVRDSFVATGASGLWIGGKDRAWKIDWSLLNARALGLHNLELSPLKGVLQIEVGGQNIKLPLFNAFAYLLDIQNFMFFVLNYIKENHDEVKAESTLQAEPGDEVSSDDVDDEITQESEHITRE